MSNKRLCVSVLISTHNPHVGRLHRTLQALLRQTILPNQWEIIVVDNASKLPIEEHALGLKDHPQLKLVREGRLGLIYGRLAGIEHSAGELLVFCDDDNLLAPDFLEQAVQIFAGNAQLGNASGKSLPEYEVAPSSWITEFHGCLALRDFGNSHRVYKKWCGIYPEFAFGGGGAVFRKEALLPLVPELRIKAEDGLLGRSGRKLTSGEDNHIIIELMKGGWHIGYFPELMMTHLVPATRLERKYLGRLNHGIAKSWVQVLALHGICPWRPARTWSVPFRKCRAYLRCRAWAGPAEYVRWRGACGHFEGRAAISTIKGQTDAP